GLLDACAPAIPFRGGTWDGRRRAVPGIASSRRSLRSVTGLRVSALSFPDQLERDLADHHGEMELPLVLGDRVHRGDGLAADLARSATPRSSAALRTNPLSATRGPSGIRLFQPRSEPSGSEKRRWTLS